jgi:hypothetical protein
MSVRGEARQNPGVSEIQLSESAELRVQYHKAMRIGADGRSAAGSR